MYKFAIKQDDISVVSGQAEDKELLLKEAIGKLSQYSEEDFNKLILEFKKCSKSSGMEFTDSFLKFWDLYPHTHRGNKQKLWNAYKRVLVQKRATEEQILNGLEKYKLSRRVAEGYIKGGEAWLNNDMFFANLPLAKQSGSNFMDRFKEQ
ncbi:MAG: hypothetical protein SOZ42_01090 [Candidatus Enterosoma sp.]|nr:hypothetical protein [Candidatus Enterosoma sp.]